MSIGRLERCLVAAALAIAATAAGAAELGTLFNTPQERERLDRLRRGEPEPEPPAPAPTVGSRPQQRPVITGFVKRSDGRNTIWVDGMPVVVAPGARAMNSLPLELPAPEGVRVERKSSELPAKGKAP